MHPLLQARWRRSFVPVIISLSLMAGVLSPPLTAAVGQPVDVTALAEKGDTDALFMLAVMHEVGTGFSKNATEAARLFQRAADSGHLASKVQLGLMYQTGTGVSRDMAKALYTL